LPLFLVYAQNGCVLDLGESREAEAPFEETAWSVVLAAGAETDARAQAALAELCRLYWRPIYTYLRRSGYSVRDAQDLTQSFFQHLLENETLRRASREKGRFRSFLLGALKLCLADERARQHTLKRGGGVQFISLDEMAAEESQCQPRASDLSPSESLDARWAGVLLERAIEKLRTDFEAEGKSETFESLLPFLAGERPDVSYQDVAHEIGISLGSVKTQIHRLRHRFATAVRREIMQTVAAPHEVENELRQLRDVFARLAEESAR
jgi:RNA polymerase sigma factor (sigma-70 family)